MKKPPKKLVCLVLALTVGCTTMRPTAPRSVDQGKDVLVYLSAGKDVELASVTVRNVRTIEGSFLRWNDDGEALILSRRVTTGGGVPHETQGETLRVAEANIELLEANAPDGKRTGVLVAIGGAVLVGTLIAIGASGNKGAQEGGEGGEGPGGTPGLGKVPWSWIWSR